MGFKRSRATLLDGKWNRITAAETKLEWGEDDEPDPDALREEVKKKLDALFSRMERLAAVQKPLCVDRGGSA